MELNARMCYIITSVLENPMDLTQLYKSLNITKRTLYYDIEKINEFLKQNNFGEMQISEKKLLILTQNPEIVKNSIPCENMYYFSSEERKAIIFLYIALCAKKVIIKEFEHFLEVSKNTVLNDIKALKSELKYKQIFLFNTPKRGYYLAGDESIIRKQIIDCIKDLQSPFTKPIIERMFQNSLGVLTLNEIDFVELARLILKNIEKHMDTKLVLSSNDIEIYSILSVYIRGMKNHSTIIDSVEKVTLSATTEYQVLKQSIDKLNDIGLSFPVEELYYITQLLLGIRQFHFASTNEENKYIAEISRKFIQNFEQISGIIFNNKEELITQMNTHVKQLVSRLKYNIRLENPILEEIKQMYPVIFKYTCNSLLYSDSKEFKGITEDEIAYLSIYVASHLKKYNRSTQNLFRKKKVLIICPAGVASSILIRDQLESIFHNLFSYDLKMPSDIDETIINNYIFVVSSAKLKFEHGKIVKTKVILTDENISKILEILKQEFYDERINLSMKSLFEIFKSQNLEVNNELFLKLLLANESLNM